jgi:Tol biopolymer transport system component
VLYQTGAYISDLRFSPDGKHIAYFEHPFKFDDRGGIAVVDLEGHRKLLADDYWGEEGIAWSADGTTVYYSAGTGYSDFSIYAATLDGKVRVAAQSAGGLVIHDVAPNGKWIATRDDLTRVMMGRAPGSSVERDLSWQDLSFPTDISNDGRMVLFTESGTTSGNNYQTCIRGTDGSPVIVLGEGAAIDLTGDGKWALAGISPNRVLVYPTGAGKTIELKTSSIAHVSDAHWVLDGKQVVLLGGPEGEAERCYLLDVDGDTPKPIGEQGILFVSPAPDGRKLLMTDSNFKMWIVPVDGSSAPVALAQPASQDEGFAGWSQDCNSVAVFERLNIPSSVMDVDLATMTRRPLLSITPPVSPTLYVSQVLVTPDRAAYTYDAVTYLSRLYTLEGAH